MSVRMSGPFSCGFLHTWSCMWAKLWVQVCSGEIVFLPLTAQRLQQTWLWSFSSCAEQNRGASSCLLSGPAGPSVFLVTWLASSVPVAVAHCLFTGCSVWENISSLITDSRWEQWACPSWHIGYNLCCYRLLAGLLHFTVLKVWEIWLLCWLLFSYSY